MQHRNPRDAATPVDVPLLKALAEVAGLGVLLLGVRALDFVRGAVRPQVRDASTSGRMARTAAPLQWRSPWWAWQMLSWAIATATAPTFLLIGSLLMINSHSDHPFFWWSLPAIVAVGNAAAIVHVNQRHHRRPYADASRLASHHAGIGIATGAALFLLIGWTSGFLPDIAAPLSGAANTSFPALTTALWSAMGAIAFGILSFAHAGVLHASLSFTAADVRDQPLPG